MQGSLIEEAQISKENYSDVINYQESEVHANFEKMRKIGRAHV